MEVRRRLSAPGLCRRPLRFTYVTLPCPGEPAFATTLPWATMSLVRGPLQACSLWAVGQLKEALSRAVAWLPAGIVSANAPDAANIASMAGIINLRTMDLRTIDLRNLISFPPDKFRQLPWLRTGARP